MNCEYKGLLILIHIWYGIDILSLRKINEGKIVVLDEL